MPGSLSHLVLRFFDVARAQPLLPGEVDVVESWLGEPLQGLFFEQPHIDQRHGYEAGLSVIAGGFDSSEVVVAAVLHDVGKRHAKLGIWGRTLASLMILAHLPLSDRFARYRDHGILGAAELAENGAPNIVVDFARNHHGQRPSSIDSATWDALVSADQPSNTRSKSDVGISWDVS